MNPRWLGLVMASYLVGSLSFSLAIVWLLQRADVRKLGSGNAGATNVLRAAGLECSGLIDEPTAANNVLHIRDGAIVDVGGGTTGGDGELAPVLARAAVATGVDGVFMEVHSDPANALSDGPNQIPLEFIEDLLVKLIAIHHAAH